MGDDDLRLTRAQLAALRTLNRGPVHERQGTDIASVRALVNRGLASWAGPTPQRMREMDPRGIRVLSWWWQWSAVITESGSAIVRRLDADPMLERSLIK